MFDVECGSGYYAGLEGKLHYRWWAPADPDWVMLMAHGFGGHSGSFARFAERLVEAGGAVFVPDRRGNGLSEGRRAVVVDFDDVAREFLAAASVREFPMDLPLVLAGQSMGGLVATRAAMLGGVDAWALVVSAARLGGWPAGEELVAAIERGEVDAEHGGGHPLIDGRVPLPRDALSRDETVLAEFAADPLTYVGPFPVETLRAYVRSTVELGRHPRALKLPVLYMHGGADAITPYYESAERIVLLSDGDLEIRIFGGARHSIYNELNKDEVYATLLSFIRRAVEARSDWRQPAAAG